MLRAMKTKSSSRRGFLWNAAGGISVAAVTELLRQAGLLAQGTAAGKVDPQEIFKRAVDDAIGEGEVGLQFAVYKDNKLVVDVLGGVADKTTGRKVDKDTLFNVFSVTKAITATALHIQAERGLVSYDAPISRYWPEFAAHGKAKATVRDALTHRTGIPSMPEGVTPEQMADYDWMVRAVANLKPIFEPGTTNAYHSYTWGWIVAEIVRRTDAKKREFRQFVMDEITKPLGITDLWIGLPAELEPRVARMENDQISVIDQSTLRGKSMPIQVAGTQAVFGRSAVRRGCIPGAGGIFNAPSCARFWALLANEGQLDGVRLVSAERVRACLKPRPDTDTLDVGRGTITRVGVGGYWLAADGVVGKGRILCHPGLGNSVGWADLDNRLAVAICHNRQGLAFAKPLATAIERAFRVV
ncbi:MAG: EstA family serine hydrolase [Acidobacteria bacterium]|nr:MAG: EstA family serine hydrolase [Acidobacteriota bacterium]